MPCRCLSTALRLGRSAFVSRSIAVVCASSAFAEKGKLRERLTPEVMKVVYPAGAERLGPEEGSPPAIAVYQGDKVVAYVFSTLDIIAAPGYTTMPFDVIGGVDLSGRSPAPRWSSTTSPISFTTRERQRLLDTFLAREAGRPLRGSATGFLRRITCRRDRQHARDARRGQHHRRRSCCARASRQPRRVDGADARRRDLQPQVLGGAHRRRRRC